MQWRKGKQWRLPVLGTFLFTASLASVGFIVHEHNRTPLFIGLMLLCAALIWKLNGLVGRALRKRLPWDQKVALHIFLRVGFAVVSGYGVTLLGLLAYCAIMGEYRADDIEVLPFVGLILTLSANVLDEGLYFVGAWKEALVHAEALRSATLGGQYESLKSQLDPHFLFNSLNTLTAMLEEKDKRSKEYIHHLLDVYQSALASNKKNVVKVAEELILLRSFVYLLQIRFGNTLSVRVDIDFVVLDRKVPPMVLQLLTENAVKHNIVSTKDPLEIHIRNEGDYLWVENNLQKKSSYYGSTGVGLANIKERYQLLGKSDMEIVEGNGMFRVRIPLLD